MKSVILVKEFEIREEEIDEILENANRDIEGEWGEWNEDNNYDEDAIYLGIQNAMEDYYYRSNYYNEEFDRYDNFQDVLDDLVDEYAKRYCPEW